MSLDGDELQRHSSVSIGLASGSSGFVVEKMKSQFPC
jgi:hypothetical protein